MKKAKYFELQLKQFLKKYPAILAIIVLTVAAVAVAAVVAFTGSTSAEERTKLKIGVVGDTKDSVVELAINALQETDSTRFSIDFIKMNETDAIEALKKREITGYVLIPENFVQDIYRGRDTSAKYVTLNAPSSLAPVILDEVLDVVKNMLGEAQKATNGLVRLSDKYKIFRNKWDKVGEMDLAYMQLVLTRESIYEEVHTGISDSVSFAGYFVCSAIMLLLLLWGIACNGLFVDKDLTMSRVLASRGISALTQTLYRYVCFFIITFFTCIIFAVIFGFVASVVDLGIYELRATDVISAVGYVFKIAPVIIMITLMQFLVYEAASGLVDMIVIQFVVALGLGYISGCFYPDYFFPESVQQIASYLPAGVGLSYMRKTMIYDVAYIEFAIICTYSAVFAVLSVLIHRLRMAGDRR